MGEEILKVHGSGNTFYLIDGENGSHNWVELTKWLCQPQHDGGADGLLVVLPSEHADARMRVINADGSEASMCGNGLRCVARYVLNNLNKEEAVIETMKANLKVKKDGELAEGIEAFSVEIAPVLFNLSSLPMVYHDETKLINQKLPELSMDINFTAVAVPNPHLIAMVTKSYIENTTHQQELAQMLNGKNAYTPDGVNVSYVLPLSHNEIFVRTYERGVGFTNACGTAMTASSLVATLLNLVDEEVVTVYNPGGFVKCLIKHTEEHTALSLIGNATYLKKARLHKKETSYSMTDSIDLGEQALYELQMQKIHERIK
ncbi:MAG: diaminopimelate epimerase [Kurthia sp.]|nr:diaminopimelate epimerase [Candidatus Kurthia equi]